MESILQSLWFKIEHISIVAFQTPAEQCAKEMAAADIVLVTQRRAFVDRVGDIYLRVVAGERDQTEKDYF
ncbi:MAG: hypothetical protein VX278_16680 [Myxococcota bacterium]|nr:hypothetical protein [Myxococcota bacterium]